MGKSKRADREFSREKRLSHENTKMKREIGRLRKILARIDLDKYGQLKETIEQNCTEESQESGRSLLERLKEEWRCTETPRCEGYLEIFIFNKIDNSYYYRKCSNCPHRTKSQKYDPGTVKGILKAPI